jgi:hypothetical protein
MLVDANLLLYASDSSSPFHERASTWLEESLNGPSDWYGSGWRLRPRGHRNLARDMPRSCSGC